jgi:hypothetical protein
MAIGEAAGIAAAWSASSGTSPGELDGEKLRSDLVARGTLL